VLGDLTSVGTLVAFGLVCFSVIWLRYQRPDLPRQFKVPLFPVVPAIGVFVCFLLAIIGVETHILWWFFWFILASIAVYFAYGYRVSPLRNKPADAEKVSS
jgi:basic amino acid/polyamine antiporter, APA family